VNEQVDDRAWSTAGAPSIALIGPGAIGTTIAALLHAEGHSVKLCGRTPRPSVELRPDDGDPIIVPGPVHTDPTDITAAVDVVLLAVKDTENAAVAPWLARLCGENTVVCVLQNGVEQVERVGPLCPKATVLPCAVWFSAETEPQGWVRLRTPVRLVLPEGPDSDRLAEMLRGPRLSIDTDPDFIANAWHKLLVNAVAGLMVLTGRKSGMFHRADIASVGRRYLAECLAVARAEGADLGDEVIDQVIDMFTSVPKDMTTSILTDREHGRSLEWDIRNGVVVRKATLHGIATPIGEVVVPLLAAASDGPG
jgi:2-dehydropantoate 2-reductase